jgi:hypothetical protein
MQVKNISVSIVGVQAEIRIQHLQNASEEHLRIIGVQAEI